MKEEKTSMPTREEHDLNEIIPVYANNVRFDMSAWDLRVLFGQLMPSSITQGKPEVDWHTDVTIPWAQAKLMHLYLGINLALYESENGEIRLPAGVIPAPVTTSPQADDPRSRDAFEKIQKMVADFREAQLGKR